MASLTQQLRHCNTSSDDSILFHHQSVSTNKRRRHNNNNLTYKQCFEIINEHENLLLSTIHTQLQSLSHSHTTNRNSSIQLNNSKVVEDVIIGYLSDNEPDLLLSMLACINLTSTTLDDSKVLPAMINSRWTPKEIDKALSPSTISAERDGAHHVTIVLYGEGYEQTAKQSVQLMNTKHHYAFALPIPTLSDKYYINSNSSVSIISDGIQQTTPNSHQSTRQESLNKSTQVSNSTAILLFTSGTSSPNGAKGVKLSHKSLYIQSIAKTQHPCNYNEDTYMIATTVPWFHVGGLSSVLAVMFAGGMLVFPPQDEEFSGSGSMKKERKGFQPQKILQSIQPKDTVPPTANLSVNTLVVVPAMLHSIVEYHNTIHSHQTTTPTSYPNVKLILVGGQSIGYGKLYKSIRNLFPNARIVQTYACTEAGSSITFEDLGYWNGVSSTGKSVDYMLERKEADSDGGSDVNSKGRSRSQMMDGATCVGLPPSHIEIGIFNAEQVAAGSNSSLKQLPNGQMGIIGTCGSHTMSGYWNRSQTVNKKSQKYENEWMLTNDLGYIHPITNKLYFCGRANDVIRTGGESVLATEVERVIGMYNGIDECAVFPLPDVKFGEAVCVAVVLSRSSASSASTFGSVVVEDDQTKHKLRAYCSSQQLAGFKQPRRVFHMKALPRNSSGKVLKHEIIRLCASISKDRSRL